MAYSLSSECCDCQDVYDNDLGPCDECDAACTLTSLAQTSRTENYSGSPCTVTLGYSMVPTIPAGHTFLQYNVVIYDANGAAIFNFSQTPAAPHTSDSFTFTPAESSSTAGWTIVYTLETNLGLTCDSNAVPIDLLVDELAWTSPDISWLGSGMGTGSILAYAHNPCGGLSVQGDYEYDLATVCTGVTVPIHKVELLLDTSGGNNPTSVVQTVTGAGSPPAVLYTLNNTPQTISITHSAQPQRLGNSFDRYYKIKVYTYENGAYVLVDTSPVSQEGYGNYRSWWNAQGGTQLPASHPWNRDIEPPPAANWMLLNPPSHGAINNNVWTYAGYNNYEAQVLYVPCTHGYPNYIISGNTLSLQDAVYFQRSQGYNTGWITGGHTVDPQTGSHYVSGAFTFTAPAVTGYPFIRLTVDAQNKPNSQWSITLQ